MRVRVTKVQGLLAGESPTGPLERGYQIEGIPAEAPMLDEPYVVYRDKRKGVQKLGLFTTTPVVAHVIKKDGSEYIRTQSGSVYCIEALEGLE